MQDLYTLAADDLASRLLAHARHMPAVPRALEFARARHAGQKRADGTDYILHPLRVALILWEIGGVKDPNMLAAALLHDTVEDGGADAFDVEDAFGHKVGDLVRAMTLPPLNPGESKHQRACRYFEHLAWEGRDPQILRSADRLDNLRTLDGVLGREREAEYLQESRELLLPLTLACNTALYHALSAALEARAARLGA
ncbi:MAG: bifunctional (p)ppGpp synthetase/guanosine-3',5'-bis(diphosphate) 3'-pyrophosphohydrolase [Planctomycetota bacterium]|nr:MAG: bifunctional (p)ppGpp synthetase/guanosine-3',5'-bis(diphosphate) 3'-pyrophosphohydrolase [Planctomycetota bacterium]